MIDNSDVGLERSHNFCEKSIFLHYVLLQFSVDALKTHLVIPLCLALHLHDLPNGVDETVLELTGGFDVLYLFIKKHSLHLAIIIRKSFEQLYQRGIQKEGSR